MLELFRSTRRATVWLIEAAMLASIVLFAASFLAQTYPSSRGELAFHAVVIAMIAQASLYYHGLYGKGLVQSTSALFFTTARALAVAAALLWLVFYFSTGPEHSGRLPAVALTTAAFVLPVWRVAYSHIARTPSFCRKTLILGSGALARECASLIEGDEALGLSLVGCLATGDEPLEGRDVIGHCSDLRRIAAQRDISLVIVASPDRRTGFPTQDLLDLKFQGIDIQEATDFYEHMTGKVHVRGLRPSQIIFARGFYAKRAAHLVKRGMDLVLSLVGIVLAAPIMLITAIAIKLDSKGPVLYHQTRAGLYGREFDLCKFRSMRTDAEAGGARFAEDNDPRITQVGRFIRKCRIDELPQLWAVVRGDMSLVGPRPERPVFIEDLERQIPFFRQRLTVKPGVTGHAQVRCRYGATVEDHQEKLEYDLFYIKSFSIWFDLSILLDTIKVVLMRIGAR